MRIPALQSDTVRSHPWVSKDVLSPRLHSRCETGLLREVQSIARPLRLEQSGPVGLMLGSIEFLEALLNQGSRKEEFRTT